MAFKWDKARYAFEHGARLLESEGYADEAAWVLNGGNYLEAKKQEANRAGNIGRDLDVPFVSQLGNLANWGDGDCGPACLAMILSYMGHNVTVNRLSELLGLPPGYDATFFRDLIRLAPRFGIHSWWDNYLTLDDLRASISRGKPVIVLVDYKSLPDRYDHNYRWNHFIVVRGYYDSRFYYNDPYWWGGSGKGHRMAISGKHLLDAWNNAQTNSPRQALLFG